MPSTTFVPTPTQRKLRIFALDPSVAAQYDTAGIGELTIAIPWEDLASGPIGQYLEVVDVDPASGCMYHPADLDAQHVLAQNGLAPSETNPQFHQQMAYAVAMATVVHFEQALGRVALWSDHIERDASGNVVGHNFIPRLRIYPHALRDRNAYYSPDKKALLFGYFPAGTTDETNTRDTIVYTVLSHDIVAHETAHALLDGVHPRFNEPVNGDVLAFHEAFADIVALFQHFSYPGVLRYQIALTRGNLAQENVLAQLAQQFGKAAGRRGALRDALGGFDPKSGKWKARAPSVNALDGVAEPHDRGAILVAAIFGAFLKVYRARTVDLYRIASEGTGVLRAGDIHPDLTNRLADEAAKCAQSILQMCIRALDYCPPVGITFGDYLRAIVTADYDLNPDDPYGYRLAMVESFRQWGIHPDGMRSMSVEALLWPTGEEAMEEAAVRGYTDALRSLFTESQTPRATDSRKIKTGPLDVVKPWNLDSDRFQTWRGVRHNATALWTWLMGNGSALLPALGLVLDRDVPATVFKNNIGLPTLEVHSVRTAQRRSARGGVANDLVVEIVQRRRGYFDAEEQARRDKANQPPDGNGDFRYRAGCTVLIDPVSMTIRRVIRTTGTIRDNAALERMRKFLTEGGGDPDNAFALKRDVLRAAEPFAMLHRHEGS